MGPESRGSKNNFCPRSAAAGESRYLLVVSTGRSGSGDSVFMMAHSWGENPSPPESFSPAEGLALASTVGVPPRYHVPIASATDPSNRATNHVEFVITHLEDEVSCGRLVVVRLMREELRRCGGAR